MEQEHICAFTNCSSEISARLKNRLSGEPVIIWNGLEKTSWVASEMETTVYWEKQAHKPYKLKWKSCHNRRWRSKKGLKIHINSLSLPVKVNNEACEG
jgi:hypothetical protein